MSLNWNGTERINGDGFSQPLAHLFHSVTKENVVPPLSDDIQLSVPEYKEKLYELIQQYKSSSKKVTQQPPQPGGKK